MAKNLKTQSVSSRHVIFDASDMDKLLLIVDGALKVQQRQDFFSWCQGLLHTLLPHDAMICVANRQRELVIDSFSSILQQKGHQDLILRSGEMGLVGRLLLEWQKEGYRPFIYQRGSDKALGKHLTEALDALPFCSVAAHGAPEAGGVPSTFFCLLSSNYPNDIAYYTYWLEVLMPYLHAAWMQVQLHQAPPKQEHKAQGHVEKLSALTAREVEILRWAHDGKSNIEIGMILGISSLTVKNHIQKILRKLNVQNRTQAVSKSLSMNILRPESH